MTQGVILTTFIIVLFSTVSFVVARTLLQQTILTQMSALVSASEDGLNQSLSVARQRAPLLASHVDIKRVFARQASSRDVERVLALLQRDEPALLGVEVYGPTAQLLARAGQSVGLPSDALRIPYHRTVLEKNMWQWYDVFTPVWDDHAEKIGYIALRYDAVSFLSPLLRLGSALGDTAQLDFALKEQDRIILLSPSHDASHAVYLSESDTSVKDIPAVRALNGQEGIGRSMDEDGVDILAAYRTFPMLGWGMSVHVDRDAALWSVRSLAFSLAMLGVLLIILSAALSYLLASALTAPLRSLTRYVSLLRPGHWQMKRTVHTGDEVEILDRVLSDVTLRLQNVYEHQESEIERRTSELKKQYALDRTILQGIDQGVVTVDSKGLVTGANPAAEKLLMKKSETLIGKKGTDAISLCEHQGSKMHSIHPLLSCLKKRVQVRSSAHVRWSIMRPDGTMLPILFAASPLLQGKTIFGAIIVLQDITEERKLDYLKSEFITLASHQLRTPLSAVRWYVELLLEKQKNLTKEQCAHLKEIDHGLVRMNALLGALLRAAHLEGAGLKPDVQTVDAFALVREMEKDCQMMAGEAGLSCVLKSPREKIPMQSDPTLLRIVLQNLLSNAVKYSKRGKRISIAVSHTKTHVSFSVQDEGVGIPTIEQNRIFQRFFRAKNVRQMDTDGNGLGLYITKSIVERLGGTIAFKSRENEGTIFTVSFPRKSPVKKT
jgi:PAS domain S-box-containing protein